MKLTFEKAKEKLLSLGFVLMPEKEDGVVILGTFGLNYCPCCKRYDGEISIFHDEGSTELWISGAVGSSGFMSSWNDPLSVGTFKWALKELGIKAKDCKL